MYNLQFDNLQFWGKISVFFADVKMLYQKIIIFPPF